MVDMLDMDHIRLVDTAELSGRQCLQQLTERTVDQEELIRIVNNPHIVAHTFYVFNIPDSDPDYPPPCGFLDKNKSYFLHTPNTHKMGKVVS